jgi:hypothetical protein
MAKLGDINSQTDVATTGQELAYVEITASVTVTATTAAAANLVIADSARTYDGSPIMVEFFAPVVNTPNVAAGTVSFDFFDAATDIGQLGYLAVTSPIIQTSLYLRRRVVPTSGSHTFRVLAHVLSGSGTVGAGNGAAGTLPPAFLRITRA